MSDNQNKPLPENIQWKNINKAPPVIIHSFDDIGSTYRGSISGITSRHPGCVFYIVKLIDKVPGCEYECISVISSCICRSCIGE